MLIVKIVALPPRDVCHDVYKGVSFLVLYVYNPPSRKFREGGLCYHAHSLEREGCG